MWRYSENYSTVIRFLPYFSERMQKNPWYNTSICYERGKTLSIKSQRKIDNRMWR